VNWDFREKRREEEKRGEGENIGFGGFENLRGEIRIKEVTQNE